MKSINNILSNVSTIKIIGKTDILISNLQIDSRKVEKNSLFFAIIGTLSDGHLFVNKAIENGATAIICENLPENLLENITYIKVENSQTALSQIACNFYDNPSKKLKLVGVTGTNGKTTIATLLYKLFSELGYKVGLISTIKNYIADKEIKATHTTPNSIELNSLFARMLDEGCEYCFMEVSSHAIDQKRIDNLHFTGGVFTNITHDHLDYHKTFKNYITAKKTFFDNLQKTAFALTNIDDKNGNIMLQNTKAKKYSYALKTMADYKVKIIEANLNNTLLYIDKNEIWTLFSGKFNAYNLLTVYATAILLGQDKLETLRIISKLKPVAGRFETVEINGITAIIDYAHTPDALKNVINTINGVKKINQNLITVVGTGGDRDKTKRPIMAKIASQNSDKVILTSDNPRTENPEQIIEDMYQGVDKEDAKKVLKITNRKEAIKTAIFIAQKNDIILIAGKGHESYQEINGVRTHFDDKEIVLEILKTLSNIL